MSRSLPPGAAAAGDPDGTASGAGAAIEGVVDLLLGPEKLFGWAFDPTGPGDRRLEVVAMLRGEAVARARTGHPRADLAGRGDGRHGFILDLAGRFRPGDLAAGRLRVHPLGPDGAMPPPLGLHAQLLAQERVAGAARLLAQAEAALGQTRLQQTLAVLGRPLGFAGSLEATEANATLRTRVLAGLEAGAALPLSPLAFPVGLRSADGSALLGQEGHLFLLAGSNGRLAHLGRDRAERKRLLRAWLALLAARQARCQAAGIRFLQMVVPEKAAFLPELLPAPEAGGPSPLLRALEGVVARRPGLAADYVSGLAVLRGDGAGQAVRRGLPGDAATARHRACRLDTHPAPAGLHALATALLGRLPAGAAVSAAPDFSEPRPAGGDLVDRFFGTPFLDALPHLPEAAWSGFGGWPERVAGHLPPGGHLGRWERTVAAGAPLPARLLVFGNSVCAGIDHGQKGLSGWLARLVRELHFHWSPALDWEVVEAVRPDIVLCQTVERFLGSVPET